MRLRASLLALLAAFGAAVCADNSTAASSTAAATPGPPGTSPPIASSPPSSLPSPPPDYTVLSDYRVRGYMVFDSIQAGGASCASSFIVACASMGPIPLRQSGASYLRIQPPSTGYAVVNRTTIIACPDVAVPISSDGGGSNLQAAGVFPADSVFPSLAPVTPFVLTGGFSGSTLQLRAVQTQCIYQFKLTQATSYILGVQPQQWISVFSAGAQRGVASLSNVLASGAAALATMWALR